MTKLALAPELNPKIQYLQRLRTVCYMVREYVYSRKLYQHSLVVRASLLNLAPQTIITRAFEPKA